MALVFTHTICHRVYCDVFCVEAGAQQVHSVIFMSDRMNEPPTCMYEYTIEWVFFFFLAEPLQRLEVCSFRMRRSWCHRESVPKWSCGNDPWLRICSRQRWLVLWPLPSIWNHRQRHFSKPLSAPLDFSCLVGLVIRFFWVSYGFSESIFDVCC